MASTNDKPKVGRPRTAAGRIEPISVAIAPKLLSRINEYAERKGISRSEAIRVLVERQLDAENNKRK